MIQQTFFLLALFSLTIRADIADYSTNNFSTQITKGQLTLQWSQDNNNIYFGALFGVYQWFAIGIQPTYPTDQYITGDLWVFQIINNTIKLQDYYLIGDRWYLDYNQDVQIIGLTYNQSQIRLNFYRKLNTQDYYDVTFLNGSSYKVFYYTSLGETMNQAAVAQINFMDQLNITTKSNLTQPIKNNESFGILLGLVLIFV
ncbi:hypothetical protein pb186bvf_005409 [Paramecium bursaria]